MKRLIITLIATIFVSSLGQLSAQTKRNLYSIESIYNLYTEELTNGETYFEIAKKRSLSEDSFQFMALRRDFATINMMLKAEEDKAIDLGVELINNLTKTAQKSKDIPGNKNFKDDYYGWIVLHNNSEFQKETALYESYSFLYITEFLYLLKEIGWSNKSIDNNTWWNNKVSFIEENIWEKWLNRSLELKSKPYWYFLRQRTHMGSHWAATALYLNRITENNIIKEQTSEVIRQYDILLKRNLKVKKRAYVWNSTYDDVSGTDAQVSRNSIVQDGSHGNHVISYVITAYELNSSTWTKRDIKSFVNTLTKFMFNPQTNTFYDNVDGTIDENRPGWGNFVGDGWVKLAKYSRKARSILLEFSKNQENLTRYQQEIQFKSNLLE